MDFSEIKTLLLTIGGIAWFAYFHLRPGSGLSGSTSTADQDPADVEVTKRSPHDLESSEPTKTDR